MGWLRSDDKFDTHPKILGLGEGDKGDARRWTWNRVLLYTTRYRSEIIPENIRESVPKATKKFLQDCLTLGLVDQLDNGTLIVHDWAEYQAGDPRKASRQARWRAGVDDRETHTVDASVDASVDGGVDDLVDASRAGVPSRPVPSALVTSTEYFSEGLSDLDQQRAETETERPSVKDIIKTSLEGAAT